MGVWTTPMDERLSNGIARFNRREFFECHEVLEEAWTPERGPRRLFLQALIHVAVGFHHCQRGNPAGAIGQLRKGLRKLTPYLPVYEGVDTARLHRDAVTALGQVEAGAALAPFPQIYICRKSPAEPAIP